MNFVNFLTLSLMLCGSLAFADRLPASFVEKKFSVSMDDSDIKEAFRLIADQGKVKIDVDKSIGGKVTYSFKDVTLEEALRSIAKDHNLTYFFEGGVIYIEKGSTTAAAAGRGGGARVYSISLTHTSAKHVAEKLPKIFAEGESLITDDASNTLIFHGSSASYAKLMRFVQAFDRVPVQIMIEAQIIETSKNFARDIGFRWGEPKLPDEMVLGKSIRGTAAGVVGVPKTPNFTGKLLLGQFSSRTLEAQILAAESNGDAKIVSRPKIVTLNNQVATIHSGVTFHVKTLSNTNTTDAGGQLQTVTGGLQKITAGLQLQVLPVVMGTDKVRLQIDVTNSEPNDSLAVEGIPGIVDNSATTSIIVMNGNTAAIGGLVKTSISKNEEHIPLLGRIPVLGWLFRSHSDKDRSSELMILIKPSILDHRYSQSE